MNELGGHGTSMGEEVEPEEEMRGGRTGSCRSSEGFQFTRGRKGEGRNVEGLKARSELSGGTQKGGKREGSEGHERRTREGGGGASEGLRRGSEKDGCCCLGRV